jgi:hypothetical protein
MQRKFLRLRPISILITVVSGLWAVSFPAAGQESKSAVIANRAMVPVFRERGIIEKYLSPEFKFVPEDLSDYQNTYVLVYN